MPPVTSVAWTQLVVQRVACLVSQPISTGSAASMVTVTAWLGMSSTADLIGRCTTAASAMPAHRTMASTSDSLITGYIGFLLPTRQCRPTLLTVLPACRRRLCARDCVADLLRGATLAVGRRQLKRHAGLNARLV